MMNSLFRSRLMLGFIFVLPLLIFLVACSSDKQQSISLETLPSG